MVMALWRADVLESEYWRLLPPGVTREAPLRRARILQSEESNRRHGLQTILRYQAEAMNAFTRALQALTLLRKEKGEPVPEPANENRPAAVAPVCTNEPEPTATEPVPSEPEPPAGSPPAAAPEAISSRDWTAEEFHAWSEYCRKRIEQFAAGPELPDIHTNEPGISWPSHRRNEPLRR
jgi:hypothetical protein